MSSHIDDRNSPVRAFLEAHFPRTPLRPHELTGDLGVGGCKRYGVELVIPHHDLRAPASDR